MRLHLIVLAVLPLTVGVAHAAEAPSGAPAEAPQANPLPAPNSGPAGGGTAVIQPPANVDPGMAKTPPEPAPEAGKMPVVPPPGTAGGNPAVIAK